MSRTTTQMKTSAFFPRLFVICSMIVPGGLIGVSRADDDVVQVGATVSADEPSIDKAHPLYASLEMAYKAKAVIDGVEDYTCVFAKRELLKTRVLKTTMAMKFREKPFSVYLKFLDLNQGREVIFVQGQNNNNFAVHEAGIKSVLGTFNLPTNGPDAMAENKYPITSIGLKNMIVLLIKQWENDGKYAGVTTEQYPQSKIRSGNGSLTCTCFEANYQKFKEFKYGKTRLYIDDETGIAIGVQRYGFAAKGEKEGPLVEEYFYTELKVNNKLKPIDFDVKNPQYTFR